MASHAFFSKFSLSAHDLGKTDAKKFQLPVGTDGRTHVLCITDGTGTFASHAQSVLRLAHIYTRNTHNLLCTAGAGAVGDLQHSNCDVAVCIWYSWFLQLSYEIRCCKRFFWRMRQFSISLNLWSLKCTVAWHYKFMFCNENFSYFSFIIVTLYIT